MGSSSAKRPRSWRCSMTGATSTARTPSSPTAAPANSECGHRHRQWIGSWPVTALPCKQARGPRAAPRRRGRPGMNGARTSCGAGTAPSSNAALPPSTRTRSSTSSAANGSAPTSQPTPTRSPPGSCSAAVSTTKGCPPTSCGRASTTPTPNRPMTPRSRCCWRSRTTAPRCAPTRPAGSWPCARSLNTSAAPPHRPTKPGSSRCGATPNASTPT